MTRSKLKGNAIPTKFFWSTPARSRKAPTVRETLPPRKCRKVDGTPSGSSEGAEENVNEASYEETQIDDDSTHQHCSCVNTLNAEKEVLKTENAKLSDKCASLEEEVDTLKAANLELGSHVFSFGQIKHQDKLVKYYTGFSTGLMFMACFNFLESSAKVMRTWKGSSTTPEIWEQHGSKRGSKPKLSLIEQFFLVMVRLRLGLGEVDLAQRFKVSQSTVSRTIITWLNLMYHKFHQLPVWLSRHKITKLMPPCFKKWYPSTRIIIDCTEFFINTPSSLTRQSSTWSAYKHHNTVKVLIGIAPHGHVTFVSNVFEGSISDQAITEQSGLLECLEHGDSVMADKGFDIKDLLLQYGVRLNIPPFRQGEMQMTPEDLMSTKKIAGVRIHVERKMQRIKSYKILAGEIDNTLFDLLEQLVFVCAVLTNFEGALVA